jgi:iron-sulfur cluster assembly protein CyaY
MNEQDFRRKLDIAFDSLKRSLMAAEDTANIEVEDQAGAIHISFEDPPARFVISPQTATSQIWISALSTSFKLDWSDPTNDFVLTKTGERLKPLVARLINEQLGTQEVTLT